MKRPLLLEWLRREQVYLFEATNISFDVIFALSGMCHRHSCLSFNMVMNKWTSLFVVVQWCHASKGHICDQIVQRLIKLQVMH